MPINHSHQKASLVQVFDKFLLSGFVIFSFIAYAIHQRFTHPDSPIVTTSPPATAEVSAPTAPVQSQSVFSQTVPVQAIPTQAPPPTQTAQVASSNGRYKDGVYQGPTVNAYYGLVSVQATVQNGSIVDVKFLQYPNDRRTSIRINSIAMPYLQQEAIRAQTANVNLISGATLTSEGFIISLNAALKTATN